MTFEDVKETKMKGLARQRAGGCASQAEDVGIAEGLKHKHGWSGGNKQKAVGRDE